MKTLFKHSTIGFITGALLVIGANSFGMVIKVVVVPDLKPMEMEIGE